jgi:hypothetical protein
MAMVNPELFTFEFIRYQHWYLSFSPKHRNSSLMFIKYYSNYMLGQKSEQEVMNTVIIMFLQHLHKYRPVLQWRMCIHAPNKLFDVCRRVKTVTTWQTLETIWTLLQTTWGKDRTSLACGNCNGHHNTNLRT